MSDIQIEATANRQAQREWMNFVKAIQEPKPAIETFTNEALMLLHLVYGDKSIRKP